jgi:hypothetical protein
VWENGGIRNHHWAEVGFGDGFDTVPDPDDSMRGYAMSQEGYLVRWNLRTGERKNVRPAGPEGVKLRFNWNAGFGQDPFDAATIYYGSQFVHKSTDRGGTWTIISGDLTTDNPEWQEQDESGGLTPDVTGAENFTSIVAIASSRLERGVIWVGTDDGRVQVTRDGGGTWTSVEGNIEGVPANTWVPHIEPSQFDAGTAYIVFDNHRRSDWTPYVFKATDYGRRWESLATDEIQGYALAIAQDPVKEDLLFLGTEFGLYVTLNGGANWFKWTHGFPTASAMDLAMQPREHDLVIGTHGRSAYVLDDIRPLRTVSAATMAEPIHLFAIPDAQQYRVRQTGESRFPGHGVFRGKNEPYGALITYSLNVEGLPHPKEAEERAKAKTEKKDEEKIPKVEILIRNADGDVVRTLKQPPVLGVNRAVWDLKRDAYKEPPRPEGERWFDPTPEVLPGTYSVTVKYENEEAATDVEVLADRRGSIPRADMETKAAALEHVGAMKELVTEAVVRIMETRKDIGRIVEKVKGPGKDKRELSEAEEELVNSAKELQEALTAMEERFWRPPDTKGYPAETDAMSKLNELFRFLKSTWEAPTEAERVYLEQASRWRRSAGRWRRWELNCCRSRSRWSGTRTRTCRIT